MKYLLNKKKLVLVLVGLIACFLVACEKKEDEKLENNQDIAPQVVIDDETTDEVNQESEKAEEIENDEEVAIFTGNHVQPVNELRKSAKSKFIQGNQILNQAIEYVLRKTAC